MNGQTVQPKFHSEIPNARAERPFAERLQQLDFPANNRPHAWFVKVPGMKDIDSLVWVPRTGLFVIEMKSWPLSGIKHLSAQRFELQPYIRHSTKKTPWEQALQAKHQFEERLRNDDAVYNTLGAPWVTPVVALYRIRRSEFLERFTGETGSVSEDRFRHLLANSILFEEDLASGDAFLRRLKYARYNQILHESPKHAPTLVEVAPAVKALHTIVSPNLLVARPASAYDKHRVQQLEQEARQDLERVSWDSPIVCTGYAGTGKTFLGLGAGLLRTEALSEAGEQDAAGLYVCFNKVLATDIARLVELSPRFRKLTFDTFDTFDLVKHLARRLGISLSPEGLEPDDWAAHTTDQILARNDEAARALLASWKIIVVDEAQDLQDWVWSLLDRLSNGSDNLFVIDGKNQLVYRPERPDYLRLVHDSVKQAARHNYLEQRRVFRTTDATFLVSQLFMETYPSLDEAARLWERRLKPAYEKAQQKSAGRNGDQTTLDLPGFDLPRRGGHAPRLLPIRAADEAEVRTKVIECLRDGYEKTKEYYQEDQPSSVLLLVPRAGGGSGTRSRRFDWAQIARDACRCLDLRYIDYSDEHQRRNAYAGDEVRICTFHSSRGLEGLHSVVLGFDQLGEVAREEAWRISNLGYIALSRSVYDTDVLYLQSDDFQRREVVFLEGVLEIVGK